MRFDRKSSLRSCQFRLFAALMLLLGSFAAKGDLTQAVQNASCNRSFSHDRCAYLSGYVGTDIRQGIVCRPASSQVAPLVLVFHGHGGCSFQIALGTRIHDEWPEATVVYLDGLTGVRTPNDATGSATGWQLNPGDQGDRDLALVDTVLSLFPSAFNTDPSRVYALGHSNGSRFLGVLWVARPQAFRAFAFNAAQAGNLLTNDLSSVVPKSVAMTMGRTDCVVPFNSSLGCPTPVADPENYQEASINRVRQILGIPTGATPERLSSQTGTAGRELGLYVHDGGHVWPPDLTPLAVQFLKRN